MDTKTYKNNNIQPKIHYITIATKPHAILENIVKRAESQNETVTILGKEEDRFIGWQGRGNFGIKLREVYLFLQRPDLLDDDIVLFTDAYDVIYCGNQEQIAKRYLQMEIPILFGAEKFCNPDPGRANEYLFRATEFPFLNSGLFIGRAWALRECMKDYVYDDNHDDQRFWTNKFFDFPQYITLDYQNQIFLNSVGIPPSEILWNGKHAIYRGKNPQFVHINGPDKTDLRFFLPKN
jgi:hypothetical protein